jgi:hypothetical protein
MNLLFDPAGPATGCAPSSRLKRLRRELLAAKLALGERMYAAGIDDGRLVLLRYVSLSGCWHNHKLSGLWTPNS